MTSSWKIFGRTLEISTIVILVLAVGYLLWVNFDSEDTDTTRDPSRQPVAITDTVEPPNQPSLHRPADTDTYRQPEETPRSTELTLPIEPYDPQFQAASAASTTLVSHACDSVGSAPPADLYQQQYQTSSTTVIKIATAAPEGSGWMKAMRASAKEIQDRTDGRVQIKYYGGGVMGNDTKVLGKMRRGQLQGGVFMPSALQDVYPDLSIYGLPFLFESEDEVVYVRRQLDGRLLRGLQEAGFVSFGFANGGFTYWMSNEPVHRLSDLNGQHVWVPEGDAISYALMEALSLSPVTLPRTDVLTGLHTGLIDVITATPFVALVFQWYTKIKYLTEMPVMFSMELMVIADNAFARLSDGDQHIVCVVMTNTFSKFRADSREVNQEAKEALYSSGIQKVMVTVVEMERIRMMAEESNRQLAEQGFFSKTLYEDLLDYIEDYRSQSR